MPDAVQIPLIYLFVRVFSNPLGIKVLDEFLSDLYVLLRTSGWYVACILVHIGRAFLLYEVQKYIFYFVNELSGAKKSAKITRYSGKMLIFAV